MGTNYIAPIWRMPRNANKDKLSNYSIDFSNTDYINFNSFPDIAENNCYSFSFWFKTSSTSNAQVICDNAQTNLFELQTRFSSIRVVDAIASRVSTTQQLQTNVAAVTNDVRDGEWHHIVFIANTQAHDPTIQNDYVADLYLDGYRALQVAFGSPTTLAGVMASTLRLNHSFTGQISQFCFFNRVLSDGGVNQYELAGGEVAQLYNLTNPMIFSAPPVVYIPIGDNSNPNATAGYPNISVGADSVFDFLAAPSYSRISLGTTSFTGNKTISFWLNKGSNNGTVLGFGNTNYYPNVQSTTLQLNNGSTTILSTGTINLNEWNHYVITGDGTTAKCYVNGVYKSTGTDRDISSGATWIGGQNNGTGMLLGKLSNVQQWKTVLTDGGVSIGQTAGGEIAELYNNGQPLMTGTQPQEANLRAWYKLNQSANWEADTAGNWQIPDAVSSYPQSFDFVPNEIITTPNVFSDIVTGSNKIGICTISYWLKVSGGSLMSFMQLVGSSTAYTAGFRIDSNNKPYYINSSGSRYKRFTALSNPSDWNHWCWIFPSDTSYADLKLYINGVEKSVDFDFSAAPANNAWDGFYINKYQNSSTATFKMSNLQLWSGNLTEPQITELYNNGVPLTTAIASENLKAWYKLDNTELFDGNNWSVNNQKYPANYTSALHFTGSVGNEHLETNSNSDLLMAGSHTFSLWLNISTPGSDSTNYIFDKGGLDYSLGFSANALRLIYYNYYDSGGASGNNKIVVLDSDWKTTYQNGWHHIFVSVDQPNLTVTLITDGTDISTHALPSDYVSPDQGAGKLNIMSYNGVTLSLAGFISNLAFFNGTALTNSQALTLYNSGTPENSISFSPTSWWKINNTSTGLLDNAGTANLTNTGGVEKNIFVSAEAGQSSGMTEQNLVNNNVSSLNGESSGMNTTNLVQSDLTRKKPFSNYSVKFDGTDYFTDTGGGFLNGATTASISVWMMLNTTPGTYSPVVSAWGSDRQYLIRHDINSANGFQFYIGGPASSASSNFVLAETQNSIPFVIDNWYNIIGTFDGTTAKIYVNGVLGGSGTATSGTINSTTSPNQIGRFSTTNINGYVSNTAFWVDTVLNQDDILNIYNNGVSQNLSNFRITPTNWFPLDQSYIYYNGSVIVARDAISGSELDGVNLIQENIVGNAPGSEANGVGNNLTIADLKVNMYNSDKNAYSINMGDYADGITNPANSGRSTNTP